jgi:hypothetical protein
LLFVLGPAKSLIESIQRVAESEQRGFEYSSIVFLLLFVVVGSFPAWIGLFLLAGRCRVDWRNNRLSVLEYAGPIRWRRRMPRGPVHKFKVKFGMATNDKPVTSSPLAELGALTAEFEQGKPRVLVLGYPRDWLEALGKDLSARVGSSLSTVGAPAVEVVDETANDPRFADVTEKPVDSSVTVEHSASGLLMIVPPAGLRKGSMGFFSFAIIWCLFMAVFTGLVVLSKSSGKADNFWVFGLFISAFWLIGLSMLAVAINMGRRKATLSIDGDGLALNQVSLLGTKNWQWPRGAIAAVRADASGMEVNERPVTELQIHPVAGKKVGFFAGRDEAELRWMATELRRGLNVPANQHN